MPQYMITYLGGEQPSTPEEGKQHFEKYKAWSTTMSGYTVVEANSIEDALVMAKACPFLDIGGSLEVSELIQMSC